MNDRKLIGDATVHVIVIVPIFLPCCRVEFDAIDCAELCIYAVGLQ